jgi:YidC/Oxa1 family membrane protein insertase
MEKRVLLAFVLSIAVLYGSRFLFAPKPSEVQNPVPAAPQSAATQPPATQPSAATSSPSPTAAGPASLPASSEIQAERAEDVVIEQPLFTATISNHGAVLKSFKLKMYTDENDQPIELVDAKSAEKVGWPLAVSTADAKLDELLANANFTVNRDANRVTLEYASAEVHARKELSFDANYQMTIDSAVEQAGRPVPHSIRWQGGFGDQSIPYNPARELVVYPNGTAYKTATAGSLKQPQELTIDRIGIQDQYFLMMYMLPAAATVKYAKQEYAGVDGKAIPTGMISIAVSDQPTRLYIGPMDAKTLNAVDPRLVSVIDYGWFSLIAKPLTVALLWIHSYIGNFGWAIIILTLLINLVLFPLRIKQQISMQKMQQIQPQMRTLQDKYKKLKANDPKRVEIQSQMMNLYKEHGVNPMSGCLPLLLQMPFLIAFYKMLSVSIELRHAPWMLWIHDLSKADPYHVMPLTMAASMIIQQRMTPTTVDPAQARMMMIMPLMLTVVFWSSQSGLMLYWLTSNVVGIAQQFYLNKYWGPDGSKASKRLGRKAATDTE